MIIPGRLGDLQGGPPKRIHVTSRSYEKQPQWQSHMVFSATFIGLVHVVPAPETNRTSHLKMVNIQQESPQNSRRV